MKQTTITCDISDRTHFGAVKEIELDVIFDHDQEDGKSRVNPYFEHKKLDICSSCLKFLMEKRRYVYAYGAMGHNKYYLHQYLDKQEDYKD